MSSVNRPSSRFIGRDLELEQLAETTRDGARLITLWGPPGVGKTRLALEYAARVERRYPGGTWVLSLSEIGNVDDFHNSLSKAFDVNLGGGEPIDVFAERLLRWKKSLVVLDGFDRLVEEAGRWVQELIGRVARVDFLVTSRRRLKLPVESACEIGPLLHTADEFFIDRVRMVVPGFEPNEEQRAAVSRIAERLDRIPLGLEIAAAQVDLLGLEGVEARLADRLLALSHRGPLESSHATLRDTIAWAWDLLEDGQRSALTQISVFSGSFTLDAAEAVLDIDGDVLGAVTDLRDRSFLSSRGGGRLECYGTVRQFVSEHSDPDLRGEAIERHRDWYLTRAEEWASRGDDGSAMDHLAEEVENLRSIAFQDCTDENGWRQAARAAVAMRELWMSRGPIARYLELLDRLVEHAFGDVPLVGLVLLARGASRRVTRRADEAQADLERAVEILSDSEEYAGRALNELAVFYHQHRELDVAKEHYERAKAAATPDGGFYANIEGNLGALAHDAGDFDAALEHYERALREFRRLGLVRMESIFLTNLAMLRQETGALDEASEDYSMALELLSRVPDPRFEAIARTNRGLLRVMTGDINAALEDQTVALSLFEEVGDARSTALTHARLGIPQAMLGQRHESRRSFDEAERILGPMNQRLELEFVELSRAFRDLEQAQTARELEDPEGVERHRASVERRVRAATQPGEDGTAMLDVFDDARIVVSLLKTQLESLVGETPSNALVVSADAQRFRPPGGAWHDFGRKASARRILAAFVELHQRGDGGTLSVEDIFRAGWGDQKINADSISNRVYVALSDLRKRGLGAVLLRGEDGYHLDPAVRIVESD